MTTNKVINGKFEFDFKKAGFKFASETEMYICNYIKIWKRNNKWSVERCIEEINKFENLKTSTTEDRIREFYCSENF